MTRNDTLRNAQSETRATFGATTRFVYAIQSLKDVRQMFAGDANSRIAHRSRDRIIVGRHCDLDLSVLWCVLDGIVEQVVKHLPQPAGVADHVCLGATMRLAFGPLPAIDQSLRNMKAKLKKTASALSDPAINSSGPALARPCRRVGRESCMRRTPVRVLSCHFCAPCAHLGRTGLHPVSTG